MFSFIEKEIKNNPPKKVDFYWKSILKKREIFEFYSIISRSQKANKKLGSICRRSTSHAHQCDTLRTVDPVSCNKWKWITETKSDVALNCLFTFISPRLLFSCAFRLAIDGFIDGWWEQYIRFLMTNLEQQSNRPACAVCAISDFRFIFQHRTGYYTILIDRQIKMILISGSISRSCSLIGQVHIHGEFHWKRSAFPRIRKKINLNYSTVCQLWWEKEEKIGDNVSR